MKRLAIRNLVLMKRILLAGLITLVVSGAARGQDFTNLNFEAAEVIPATTNFGNIEIATGNALPGWSALSGTNQLSLVQYNFGYAPPLPVGLFGSNSAVIDGNFNAFLAGGAISQTGLVPSGTKSLLFDATSSSLLVSLGSQSLSYMAISNALNSYGYSHTIYGVDISGFAGQVETLTFSGIGPLDDIRFSSITIPEPAAISLLCLGGGVLFYARKRRQS